MRLAIDQSRCTKCGKCLEACPKLPYKKDYKIFDCSCQDKKCLYSCPREAIFETNGIVAIDKKKCNGCGDCLKVCERKAIVRQISYFSKCDLCFESGRRRCIEACPEKAISLEHDEFEKERIREIIGWRKIKYNIEKKLEDNDGFQIVRVQGKEEPVFSIRIREIGYDEALLISKVLEEFRDSSDDYDEKTIVEIIDSYCARNDIILSKEEREFINGQVRKEVLGYSVLDDFVGKSCLEEIAVLNENSPIYVYHKTFGWLESDIQIENGKKIVDLINKMSRGLGRRVTLQRPKLNADIKLGRIHAAISPIASGATLTIRKFNKEPFTPYDLISNKTVTSEALAFLWLAVQCDFNMLICGNTGSGKTSTLNTLFSFVPKNERIIVIEETPEIVLPHKHQVKLVVNEDLKIKFEELITDTLRMRPDRIIVGEVRSAEESKALINTMLAGQGKGSFSTFHAQNGREALIRLKSLGISEADLCSLDIIVVQRRWTRYRNGPEDVRRIIEIDAVRKDSLDIVKLFEYDQKKDCLRRKDIYGTEPFKKICFNFSFGKKKFEQELKERIKLLESRPASFEDFFQSSNKVMGK
jgi:Flp pilus assembly CpaF family ATPase/NAD-dependent dihydropyrimidine dehydrogenase PreA subunit